MKKRLFGILLVSTAIMGSFVGCGRTNQEKASQETTNQTTVQNEDNEPSEKVETEDASESADGDTTSDTTGKVLVVYYSAQGHTKTFADAIAQKTGADTFEIVPTDVYTEADLDWTDDESRVSKEHDDESLRDVELAETAVENWDSYDTVFIGYPIWWGIAAWPVDNFVKANDFTGKTVIPFCTAASSGIGESGELLAEMAGTGDWQEGIRFQQNESTGSVKKALKDINY